MGEKRLFALRGAVCCENSEGDIQKRIAEVYDELLFANNLDENDIVSVVFSVTGDLDAKNPATALRELGRAGKAAILVSQEAFFQGSLDHVVRILVHCYLDLSQTPVHVYRNGAEVLRQDRKQKTA